MKKPNIFQYATSELSQDAFLCWFIAWADKRQRDHDKLLNKCAGNFIQELLGVSDDYEIKTIKVYKQWKKIDVSVLVNDEFFIVIEDKIGTSEHSNQLKRYAEIAKKEYEQSSIEIRLAYFKMEEQGKYKNIEEAGFSLFSRKQMLKILNLYILDTSVLSRNHIISDYYENLLELDEKINSYKKLPINQWNRYSWQGFYAQVQSELRAGSWKYVANAAGGFLGFWWCFYTTQYKGNEFKFYLQLEQDKLTFRLQRITGI